MKIAKRIALMKKFFTGFVLSVCLICIGCANVSNTVTQTSTIDALLAGHYDGQMSCGQLLQYGDLGIGTFDKLDGEMVVLDGKVYQVKADGKIYRPDPNIKTPFASVCKFCADETIVIKEDADFEGLEKLIDDAIGNGNVFCAVKIEGEFSYMKTRSVPAQSKPYPELADVAKRQAVFEMEDVHGSIVGFRCPEFVKGVNVPGYHLHFLSEDKTQGGHILACNMKSGTVMIDVCGKFLLILPDGNSSFADLDLTKDRTEELDAVEK